MKIKEIKMKQINNDLKNRIIKYGFLKKMKFQKLEKTIGKKKKCYIIFPK